MHHEGPTEDTRLVAILLITHSRTAAKLVFQYPPIPQRVPPEVSAADIDAEDDSTLGFVGRGPVRDPTTSTGETSSGQTTATASTAPSCLFDVSEESLEKLLSPGRWCDRKRFKVSFGELTFVGHPVYDIADGKWTKGRRRAADASGATNDDANGRPVTPTAEDNGGIEDENEDHTQQTARITMTGPTPAKSDRDFTHVPDSFGSRAGMSFGSSMNSGGPQDIMTAFNVVFATTRSRGQQGSITLSGLYEQVAKKLSKALAYLQKQADYVAVESRKMSQLKVQAKQGSWNAHALCEQTLQSSDLASALKLIYDNISMGQIAAFRIHGIQMSLQVVQPGKDETNEELGPHRTIFLLEEKEALLRSLAHALASPLATFIRDCTPTKSLQKQSARLGIPIHTILSLAKHLIKWRKACCIRPLHIRNTYIVSPKAPLGRLKILSADYSNRFAGLPSLPQMLAALSTRPVKYGLLIPSRDHRLPYFEILAYLVRHDFVELLKSSGWLRILPVESGTRTPAITDEGGKAVVENKNRVPLSVSDLLSPQLKPTLLNDDDVISVSSERTAIPLFNTHQQKQQKKDLALSTDVSDTADGGPRLVTEPLDANISAITTALLDAHGDREVSADFFRLSTILAPYLDGETVLEDVAALEGLKRSEVDGWLDELKDIGALVSFRYT